MTVNFSQEEVLFMQALVANEVQVLQTGRKIPSLTLAASMDTGDLIPMRDTSAGTDKAISYQNLLKSIGNTAVDGFIATTDVDEDDNVITDNGIILTSVNGVVIDRYYEGMKISFKSPLTSDGQVKIKIDSLTYKNLFAYNSTTTAVIKTGDWVEAALINGVFEQTNNAQFVYTNDYTVLFSEEGTGGQYTNIFLSTAFGALKTTYYTGMTINFTCPIDTQGFVRINIDGLGYKDVSYGVDDLIPLALYENQMVQAVFDGEAFKPNKFEVRNPKVQVSVIPDPDNEGEVLVPQQNKLEFTVGANGDFTTLPQAITALMKEYGADGGGRKVTLTIMSVLNYIDNQLTISTNLNWITLAGYNDVLNFTFRPTAGNAHFFILSYAGYFFNIKKNTSINCSGGSGYDWINATLGSGQINLSDISITSVSSCLRTMFMCQSGVSLTLRGVTLIGATNANIWGWNNNSSSSIVLINCISRSYGNHSVITGGARTSIENCDLSKNGQATAEDIAIATATVTQINSRAKSNLAPNTNNNTGTYWVTGSQDAVGS